MSAGLVVEDFIEFNEAETRLWVRCVFLLKRPPRLCDGLLANINGELHPLLRQSVSDVYCEDRLVHFCVALLSNLSLNVKSDDSSISESTESFSLFFFCVSLKHATVQSHSLMTWTAFFLQHSDSHQTLNNQQVRGNKGLLIARKDKVVNNWWKLMLPNYYSD